MKEYKIKLSISIESDYEIADIKSISEEIADKILNDDELLDYDFDVIDVEVDEIEDNNYENTFFVDYDE